MSESKSKDKITIKDIQLYGHCGVTEEEKKVGGRYSVDIELTLDLRPAGKSDLLSDTADYSEIYHLVEHIGKNERFNLIEALAEKIAKTILSKFPVHEVLVRVKKLSPPIEGVLGYVGVEIARRRSDILR